MELKVESELVLKAAKESPRDDVRKALKTIFPRAFEDDKYFDLSSLGDPDGVLFSNKEAQAVGFGDRFFLKVAHLRDAMYSELHQKSFFVAGGEVNWELRPMGFNYLLIPTAL